ncbi:MAG TPA: radical SAM/SPASM domain-containing protein [Victivallales bacterium]|nr:radical SAM/SPASM domain-containing protein [Victivallales bacterium]
MAAKNEPRINLNDRTPLQNVIPLSTPFVLFLDPSSLCNFKCKFCPTGEPALLKTTNRFQGLMDLDLYKKIIDDLQEFDRPLKVLRLYKDGEPFLNPHLAEMVSYAKESGYANLIDTTTNGALLTPEKAMPVIEAGIDQINISLDGMSNEQFLEFTRTKVDFDKFVKNIKYLYKNRGDCKILIKTVNEILDSESKKRFLDIFSPIVDKIFIENIAPCWPGFDVENKFNVEITKGIYGQKIEQVETCPYIFYLMAINSSGLASLCFLDWGHDYIIGNTRCQSVKNIWNSQELFDYQVKFLKGDRKNIKFCKDCSQLTHCMADNIDDYADDLLDRINYKCQ